MQTTAIQLLNSVQKLVDKYGKDSPVFGRLWDRTDIEQAIKDNEDELELKPLTDELVESIFEQLEWTQDVAEREVTDDVFEETVLEFLAAD